MDYFPPYDAIQAQPNGWQNAPYINGQPGNGIEGSIPNAGALEYTQREILSVQDEAGIARNANDFTQMLRAIRGGLLTTFVDSSTTANLIVVTPKTAHTALFRGLPLTIFPANTNTGPATLRVSGLAAALKTGVGNDPVAGDIVAGRPFTVVHDGTVFRLLAPVPSDSAKATTYFGVDTGAVNALVVNSDAYGTSFQNGRPIQVLASRTTTGPATLNVNGLGSKAIKRPSGSVLNDLKLNDIRGGQLVTFTYDGIFWQIQSPLPGKQYSIFNQNYAAVGGIMSSADMGSIVQMGVASSGAYTITLPAQGTTGNGETLTFYHNGSTTNVLACAGTDKLAFPDGTLVSSVTMGIGDTIEITSTGVTGNWIVTGGSILNRYCRDFLFVPGSSGSWFKLPNGIIVQMGYGITSSTSGSTVLTLPTTFPTQGRSVVMTDAGASAYPFGVTFSGTGVIQFWARNFSGALVSGEQGFYTAIGS